MNLCQNKVQTYKFNENNSNLIVNMGRIHKELGKFLMISSNLIKWDDELVIGIGKNGIL